MERVVLERLESGDQGTFGRIHTRGLTLFTVERPWLENRSNVSCIPTGIYRCVWTYSPRFNRKMYLVDGVPNRSGVRFHSANLASQLNGCVALGEKMGWLNRTKAVLLSAPAVRSFESHMAGQPFELEVVCGE